MPLRPIVLSALLLIATPMPTLGGDVNFTPSAKSTAAIAPELLLAHAAIAKRDFAIAYQHLARLIGREPFNTDALIALATLAHQRGDRSEARGWLRRALSANPADPNALAAFLNAGGTDPRHAESRLKTLLASHPDSAAICFALGNLYARQQRWPEAQQAYFQAVAGESGNPDYLFNLAISLDHLHQARLAASYYRQAIAASGQRPSAFELAAARNRLLELDKD